GAYVPLDPDYPKDRLDYMVEDSQVKIVLIQQQFAEMFVDSQSELLVIDDAEYQTDQGDEDNPNIALKGNNMAYVFYTSGSTGRPKGAMNAHSAIRNRIIWLQETYRMGEYDKLLQKSPYSFDVSIWEFFW